MVLIDKFNNLLIEKENLVENEWNLCNPKKTSGTYVILRPETTPIVFTVIHSTSVQKFIFEVKISDSFGSVRKSTDVN